SSGEAQILDSDLARPAELVHAPALRAAHMNAANAQGDGLDGHSRAALSIGYGRTNRFAHRFLIADAPLRPPGRRGQSMPQITEILALQRANHAARPATAGVDAHNEWKLRGSRRGHSIPPP